jgi:hypothetical protein
MEKRPRWEWFRKKRHQNAFRIFENGKHVGEWTTYDDKGKSRQSHDDEISPLTSE